MSTPENSTGQERPPEPTTFEKATDVAKDIARAYANPPSATIDVRQAGYDLARLVAKLAAELGIEQSVAREQVLADPRVSEHGYGDNVHLDAVRGFVRLQQEWERTRTSGMSAPDNPTGPERPPTTYEEAVRLADALADHHANPPRSSINPDQTGYDLARLVDKLAKERGGIRWNTALQQVLNHKLSEHPNRDNVRSDAVRGGRILMVEQARQQREGTQTPAAEQQHANERSGTESPTKSRDRDSAESAPWTLAFKDSPPSPDAVREADGREPTKRPEIHQPPPPTIQPDLEH